MDLVRILVIGVLIAIVASLGSALFHLSRSGGDSKKMARALTIRVGLSVALFILSARRLATSALHHAAPGADLIRRSLDPVDEDEQAEPDHVDEVPVPGHRFEREVALRREVPLHHAQPDDSSMIAPIVTCRPWKPVSMKNVEP